MPPVGPLCSTAITAASSLLRTHPPGSRLRRRFASRLAAATLLRGFLRAARSPSLFPLMTLHACRRPLPRREMPSRTDRRWLLLPSLYCHQLGSRNAKLTEAFHWAFILVAARALAHPAQRGFVSGLRRRDLPRRRHSSYAASVDYRFRTFTLWIHEFLQASRQYYLSHEARRSIRPQATSRKRRPESATGGLADGDRSREA